MLYLIAGLSVGLTAVCLYTLHVTLKLVVSERDTASAERSATAAAMDRERALYAQQIADLCQRIQAPAEAVIQHAMSAPIGPQPQAVPMDDDDAFWESQMTKEQIASAAAELELAESGA